VEREVVKAVGSRLVPALLSKSEMRAPWILTAALLAACGNGNGMTGDGGTPLGDSGADGTAGDSGSDGTTSDADMGIVDATSGPDGTAPDASLPPIGEIVMTDLGDVRGEVAGDLVVFRGIPYAAPPVGALRFKRPAPHPGFGDVYDATTFGPRCPQPMSGATVGEEDCLHLNVWAPTASGPRPVMVFIHGGGYLTGSSTTALYDGTDLALTGDVVVVTLNYRLGLLGYLASEDLAAEEADGSTGNFGTWDQIAALEWVQRNIAAFGGDPDDVTVFGESAGAISVCTILGAPAADGLYDSAIIESGGGCNGFEDPRVSLFGDATMIDRHAVRIAELGCGGLSDVPACLRGLTVDQIVGNTALLDELTTTRTLATSVPFAPSRDGVLMDEDPYDRVAGGRAPDVPILIGTNADESFLFTVTTAVLTARQYENRVRDVLGEDADEVLAVYPASDFARPKQAYNTLMTDLGFVCPAMSFVEAAAGGTEPAFSYHYTHVLAGVFGTGGSLHGLELFFVFGNFPDSYTPRAGDLALEETVQTAWTTFARSGAPEASPTWPPYAEGTESIALLTEPLSMIDEIREGRCAELRRIGVVP
jgi:para-nitrobenzyl esterase